MSSRPEDDREQNECGTTDKYHTQAQIWEIKFFVFFLRPCHRGTCHSCRCRVRSRANLRGRVWLLGVSILGLRALAVGLEHLYLFRTEKEVGFGLKKVESHFWKVET